MLVEFLRRFGRDRGGNTAIVFALSLVPIIFLTGLSLDFSSAAQKRIQLNVRRRCSGSVDGYAERDDANVCRRAATNARTSSWVRLHW